MKLDEAFGAHTCAQHAGPRAKKKLWTSPTVIRAAAASDAEKPISDQYGEDYHYDTQTTIVGPS